MRRIFDEYANTSQSTRRLALMLAREGCPAPIRAGEWLPDSVAGILRNPSYAGLKYITVQARRARRVRELREATWKRLIDRPTFERVQRLMDQKQPPIRKGSEAREYVFQGLLWCRSCGQPMRATTVYGIPYYHCRRDLADRCYIATHSIREDRLRPWADYLFAQMAKLEPDDFAEAIRAQRNDERLTAVDAIRDIERCQQRVQRLYELEHIDEDAYMERWTELEQLKQQWRATPTNKVKPVLPIANLSACWSMASPRQKRDLLALLFEKLWVRRPHQLDAQREFEAARGDAVDVIEAYVPRSEYPIEVLGLVGLLIGMENFATVEVPAIPNPGRRRLVSSGKGGIHSLVRQSLAYRLAVG